MKNQPSYITNAQGEKTAVILSLEDYQELLDDAEDLAAIAEITVKKSAKKSLLELPAQIVQNLTAIIDTLAENPRPNNAKKLTGSDNAYRIRSGNYRIIYTIFDNKLMIEVILKKQLEAVYLVFN
jgi:mRNA interferase RelE/StbE